MVEVCDDEGFSGAALYYPSISLTDGAWLKAMSLFYGSIYRLVPYGVELHDSDELQPLLEDGLIGRRLDPAPYVATASAEFLQKIQSGAWDASALPSRAESNQLVDRLHRGKVDENVRSLFVDLGYEDVDDWYEIPKELASTYMLFLASQVSTANDVDLITNNWNAWTATSYFEVDGAIDEFAQAYRPGSEQEHEMSLFSMVLQGLVPINIREIPAREIAAFRRARGDEMAQLREAVSSLRTELINSENPQLRADIIRRKLHELERSMKDFRRSADLVNARGWFGVSFMGFSAPTVLGNLLGLPGASTAALAAGGIALGEIYNLSNRKQEERKLRREASGSYLCALSESFRAYTPKWGGGDVNFHAFNCLEEFVND